MNLNSIKAKVIRRLDVFKFIWFQNKWRCLAFILVSLMNLLVQLSTISFLLPIIDFMRLKGEIDYSEGYWKVIYNFFNFFNFEVSFINILFCCFLIMSFYQLFNYWRQYFSAKIKADFQRVFQENLSKTLLYSPYEKVSQYDHSSIFNMFINQTYYAAYFIVVLFEYLYTIVQIGLYILFLLALSIKLTFLVGTYVLIQLLVVNWRTVKIKLLGSILGKSSDKIAQLVQEFSPSLKFLIVLKQQDTVYALINRACSKYRDTSVSIDSKRIKIECSQETLHMGFVIVIIFFSYQVWQVPFSNIMLFLFVLTRLIPSLKSYNNHNSNLNTFYSFFNKLRDFIGNYSEQMVVDSKKLLDDVDEINLNDVSFSYSNGVAVLKNINVSFVKNKVYAIFGESGAGKTTLVDIILGLLSPKNGEVTLYYEDKKYSEVQALAFYLPQIPIVFSGTVRENFLNYSSDGQSVTDELIIDALKKVNLWEHFKKLEGLDTMISESGSNISIGQKQRLSLSRVFLHQYQLIVLDEFTSSIDQVSKDIILSAIKNIKNSIVIFVTHDKDTGSIADQIFYLDDGVIKNCND